MSLFSVFKKEILNLSSLFFVVLTAFFYVSLTLFLLNYQLFTETVFGPFNAGYKFTLISTLFLGAWTAMSHTDFELFILNSILVGVNVVLIFHTLSFLSHKRLHLSVGGATIIGLVTTGCTSCGFSLLSALGLSTSLSFLPFHGVEFQILSVLFLFISAFYMLSKLRNTIYCKK